MMSPRMVQSGILNIRDAENPEVNGLSFSQLPFHVVDSHVKESGITPVCFSVSWTEESVRASLTPCQCRPV